MEFHRYTPEELSKIPNNPPEQLDYLEFIYKGVTFHCYGILHGITGGLNREYAHFIKTFIRNINGVKLAEKGMKQLYRHCGIDEELEDWMVLRNIDCLVMGFQLLADPRCLWMITVDALREQLRKRDPYIVNNRGNITDLGESPYFHYLDEFQRRELVGFLPSSEAISKDIDSMSYWYRSILPKKRHTPIKHPQWRRILLLERLMHIPCRSIHMLHYALAYAKQHNHKQINLFVGETHNTDMQFLAQHMEQFRASLDSHSQQIMSAIIDRSTYYGSRHNWLDSFKLACSKAGYILFLLIGAAIPVTIYLGIFKWIRL